MKTVATNHAPAALGPYAQAQVSGSFVFTSGQIGIDPATGVIPDGIEAQAHQVFRNLTAVLRERGKRVLLCDFDPQANATSGMGVDKSTSNGVYDVIMNGASAESVIVSTPYGDVLPSSKALAGAGVELISMDDRQFLLKAALRQVADKYDFIFIDCPPSLELLTLNALCAADSVLIPVQCEYYALEGLSDLMGTLRAIKRRLNPKISVFGVLLTMYDGRTNLSIQVAQELKRFFAGKVYSVVIPRNVRVSEAPSHGKPIFAYDRTSRGAEAYGAFAREFLRKNQGWTRQ